MYVGVALRLAASRASARSAHVCTDLGHGANYIRPLTCPIRSDDTIVCIGHARVRRWSAVAFSRTVLTYGDRKRVCDRFLELVYAAFWRTVDRLRVSRVRKVVVLLRTDLAAVETILRRPRYGACVPFWRRTGDQPLRRAPSIQIGRWVTWHLFPEPLIVLPGGFSLGLLTLTTITRGTDGRSYLLNAAGDSVLKFERR